jgi:hypothetical protein
MAANAFQGIAHMARHREVEASWLLLFRGRLHLYGGWLFRVQRIPFAPDVKPRLVHEPLNAVENVRQAAGVIPGFADISGVEMNWNATQSTTNACYLYYAPATNVLQLSNDAGSSWVSSATLGV